MLELGSTVAPRSRRSRAAPRNLARAATQSGVRPLASRLWILPTMRPARVESYAHGRYVHELACELDGVVHARVVRELHKSCMSEFYGES